ncbi:MAG: hypothetical protein WBQ55_01955 [Xanthobacteraceae bacterium]
MKIGFDLTVPQGSTINPQAAKPVPKRDDHALAKFIRHILIGNARWDGLQIAINDLHCDRVVAPWVAAVDDVDTYGPSRLDELMCLLPLVPRVLGISIILALAAVSVTAMACHHGSLPTGLCRAVAHATGLQCP